MMTLKFTTKVILKLMQDKPTSFSIKNWSDIDKTSKRELAQKGRSVLSDARINRIILMTQVMDRRVT
jgi:hypothetical protein